MRERQGELKPPSAVPTKVLGWRRREITWRRVALGA